VAYPLSVIFNHTLQTGSLPDIWRTAVITPVFKKGSPSDAQNYRPISLTCVACKLMECGVRAALLTHLSEQNIITPEQHGFLSRRSTVTNLLECSSDWNIAIDAGCGVDIIYLDYAKAFDSVVHSKLIAKLELYGTHPIMLHWINSFLSDRSHKVRVGSSLSDVPVISGVPQGSVLGPVLFIIHVHK